VVRATTADGQESQIGRRSRSRFGVTTCRPHRECWRGLWHGFIAPFVFVASLFKSNLNVYEVHNNRAWYNFGYLFGLACFFGGRGNRAARRK
jgi:hypothetical protein